tara:strand:+ start:2038 stop:3060 length:1023 start_codon:yes stop_codon:yes gene_type:complete
MAEALGNPKFGYYTTQNPIGAKGDFITAPEVSQMFGELVGLWCADTWKSLGSPSPFNWVEIGPGRGTLMRDAYRAAGTLSEFRNNANVHLVETSPVLREYQREALPDIDVKWHEHFHQIPSGPTIVVANEMFDALPIHQFERTIRGWHERRVDTDGCVNGFRFVLGPVSAAFALVPDTLRTAPIGSVVEVSPASVSLMRDIAERVVANMGAALIIDYGSLNSRPRDTLQAVINHATHDVLVEPGSADLSAHVDFVSLAQIARESGAEVWGPVLQGEFLDELGIWNRASQLKNEATANQSAEIDTAVKRLTEPGQMGTLFKVMAISPPGNMVPVGFSAGSC